MFACGSVKAWTTLPKVSIAQRAPASVISASNASRSGLGATGSAAPWTASTAALISPRFAGCGVASVPCMETTACTSAPGRARSRTLRPPKQKPTAAPRSAPAAARAEAFEATEAEAHGRPPAHVSDGAPVGLARQRVERRCNAASHSRHVRHEGPQELHRVFRSDRAVAFTEHVGDEDDIAFLREHLTGLDRRLDHTAPVRRCEQQRPNALRAFIPDERPAAAQAGHGIEDALNRHNVGFLTVS